jgi:hypothetical protein
MLHVGHGTGEVDRERAVSRLDRGVGDALAGERQGIVDEDVQLAEPRQGGRVDLLPRRLVGPSCRRNSA